MPILAAPPVDPTTIPSFPVFAGDGAMDDSRSLAFRTLDGAYPFPGTGNEFVFMPDIEGLDIPPRELIRKQLPGLDGTQLREIRTLEREVFLPIWLASWSSHVQYLDRRDALADLFEYRYLDYQAEAGTLDLEAISTRGVRRLRCVYQSGMSSGSKHPDGGAYWAKLGLTLLAVQPYWVADDWSTPVIQLAGGGTEPNPFLTFPLEFTSSTVFGNNVPIEVGGDVPSWVTVEVVGPAASVLIQGEGLTVSIPEGLGDDEEAVIITDPRKRTALFTGVKNWARIGAITTWKPLAPGTRSLDIVMTGGGVDSRVVVHGPTLYQRPW